jgi:S-DNA-T family DNA segregation ATPase FtsK/SpoIIIE
MATNKSLSANGLRYAGIGVLLALTLFGMLGLFSYDWNDVSALKAPPGSPPSNLIGPVGAWLSFLLLMALGIGAYLVPVFCFALAMLMILDGQNKVGARALWSLLVLLSLTGLLELQPSWLQPLFERHNLPPSGGLWSQLIVQGVLVHWLSPFGAGMLLGVLFVGSLVMVLEWQNVKAAWDTARQRLQGPEDAGATTDEPDPVSRANARVRTPEAAQVSGARSPAEEAMGERRRRRAGNAEEEQELPVVASPRARALEPRSVQSPPTQPESEKPRRIAAAGPQPEPREKPKPPEPLRRPQAPAVAAVQAPPEPPPPAPHRPVTGPFANYKLPPISLVSDPPPQTEKGIAVDTATTSHILVETMADFGIEVQVTHVETGPVVTRYELLPAPGVRVERISGLANNLALSLKATSVRVQAPIPGKGVVGIEVPNHIAQMVTLREVLDGDVWRSNRAAVPIALGKDVGGNDIVADLARMPHLLIAGATGSGKTVCMNAILAGLLMSRSPADLRLILVDPKIVEFAQYNNLPHLVVPVITDPKKVALGLRWAINEMEKRYKVFARAGVRNIESFNSREIVSQGDLFGAPPEDAEKIPARVPYIVIVIDELADLMLADQAEIENCIARLAQLSRAVGIHMIIATQRPSVNVITGTIKANFPARLAFQVAQKVDSRTILDTAGADKLLGRGDMLFLPPGSSKLIRAQGAMVSDPDIKRIVEHIRAQAAPEYEVEIKEKLEKGDSRSGAGDDGEGVDDALLEQCVQVIRETRRASTSSLQRRLRIGYTRAARIMDILEERGVVGPPRGSDPREILIDLDGEIPDNAPAEGEQP